VNGVVKAVTLQGMLESIWYAHQRCELERKPGLCPRMVRGYWRDVADKIIVLKYTRTQKAKLTSGRLSNFRRILNCLGQILTEF